MAVIQKIREKTWLLIAIIALAIFSFLLMDLLSSRSSLFGSNPTTVGKVAGRTIGYQEFEAKHNMRFANAQGGDVYAQRNAIWNMYVDEAITDKEAEHLGIGVQKEELNELLFGPNFSPIIRRDFPHPNMQGMVNFEQINQIKQGIQSGKMNPNFGPIWLEEEKEVIVDRKKTKLNNIIAKGFYTPTWMVEMQNDMENTKVDFQVVKVPFEKIPDSEIKLEEKDYENYIAENKALYILKKPAVSLKYVAFDVKPTLEDSLAIRKDLANLIPNFKTATDNTAYINSNRGSYDDKTYFVKSELNPTIADSLMNSAIGTVYGPFVDGKIYKVAKIIDKKLVPDSVQVRHILIAAQENNPLSFTAAHNKVDSLKTLLEKGTHRFDSLAIKFSGDGGSAIKGGDLGMTGYPSNFVKPFKDAVFFGAGVGKLQVVESQFGVHLLEVTKTKGEGKNGVRIAFLERPIVPSKSTENGIYQTANEFASKYRTVEQLEKAVAEKKDYKIESEYNLGENDFFMQSLGGGDASREIIRWANVDGKVGEVSSKVYAYKDQDFFYNNKYVVAALATKNKAGLPSTASLKKDLEKVLISKKKGELLASKITSSDLAAIATQFETKTDSISSVSFASNFIPGLGNEPKVVAGLYNMKIGDTSKPIVGNGGVYVVKVTNRLSSQAAGNIAQQRASISNRMRNTNSLRLLMALRDLYPTKDNRGTFY